MKKPFAVHTILTIAGSDSGGGAGIQADLKTITALGCYGMTVITAVTAQNTCGVIDYMPVSLDIIEKQFDAVGTDITIDTAKTGMLANPEIVQLTASKIQQYSIAQCVVDPVMVAKGGSKLLSDDAVQSVLKYLIPVAYIITPNIHEAEMLTGTAIRTIEDMKNAAHKIYDYGARYVVVKGGHLEGEASDVIFDGKNFIILKNQRIDTINTHGTGCTFSAAIAAFLSKGCDGIEAVTKAKEFITKAIRFSFPLGKGHGPTNHLVDIVNNAEKINIVNGLNKAFAVLHRARCGGLLVSGVSNIGYALPYASGANDIAMFPGGIITHRESIYRIKDPAFDSAHPLSDFMKAIVSMNYRTAVNIIKNDTITSIVAKMNVSTAAVENIQDVKNYVDAGKSSLAIIDIKDDPMLYIIGGDPIDAAHVLVEIFKQVKEHDEATRSI